ncbi:hypothetical protein QIS99_00160 [Streptomyces sp. B-S-A8]|uniref:Serine/threonine protein kinase n=1 Tax=Streptomyces solicavernae TaxID=3043614 RepID=A0ABT6RJN6_9ACTN|nr:hypothetical protein [Streptomyces sp. B-S-A8]MDI3384642.1 hypothetical protein [Streptomyces sp. B-S-A8]
MTVAWAAVAAVAGGLGAWTLAGFDGAAGERGRPLDDAAVRRALASPPPASAPPPPPSPSASREPQPAEDTTTAPAPPRRSTLRFTGGTATAECRADGTVYLTSWSPADGYHVEEYARGPARTARLELEPSAEDAGGSGDNGDNGDTDDTDNADDTAYVISCGPTGKAQAAPAPEDDG